jgi:hypothetical protein
MDVSKSLYMNENDEFGAGPDCTAQKIWWSKTAPPNLRASQNDKNIYLGMIIFEKARHRVLSSSQT